MKADPYRAAIGDWGSGLVERQKAADKRCSPARARGGVVEQEVVLKPSRVTVSQIDLETAERTSIAAADFHVENADSAIVSHCERQDR